VTTFDSGEALELSEAELDLQAWARRFVDEVLIPHEVEAELAGGKISAELKAHISAGLGAIVPVHSRGASLRAPLSDRG
jgi:hypothetical protein